jgi:hypothetical protein
MPCLAYNLIFLFVEMQGTVKCFGGTTLSVFSQRHQDLRQCFMRDMKHAPIAGLEIGGLYSTLRSCTLLQ